MNDKVRMERVAALLLAVAQATDPPCLSSDDESARELDSQDFGPRATSARSRGPAVWPIRTVLGD